MHDSRFSKFSTFSQNAIQAIFVLVDFLNEMDWNLFYFRSYFAENGRKQAEFRFCLNCFPLTHLLRAFQKLFCVSLLEVKNAENTPLNEFIERKFFIRHRKMLRVALSSINRHS